MGTPAALSSIMRRAHSAGPTWLVPGTNVPLRDAVSGVARQVRKDAIPALAGNLAYRLMFAFFPAIISILWLLSALNAGRLGSEVSDIVGTVVPGVANNPLKTQIEGAPPSQAAGEFTLGVAFCLVVALWAISEAFRATMHAMNVIYAVEERRGAARRLLLSVLVSVVTMSLFVCALVLIISGADLAAALSGRTGLEVGYQLAFRVTSWAVVIAAVLGAISLTYYFAPDVEQRVRWVRFGSVLAVCAWLLFTMLFGVYVNVLSRPDETYGALAGIAFFMVYLYVSSFIVLLGAEFNQAVEHWSPEGKNAGDRAPSDTPAS